MQSDNLLLPVDFDFAFFKKEFINIDAEKSNYGEYDEI